MIPNCPKKNRIPEPTRWIVVDFSWFVPKEGAILLDWYHDTFKESQVRDFFVTELLTSVPVDAPFHKGKPAERKLQTGVTTCRFLAGPWGFPWISFGVTMPFLEGKPPQVLHLLLAPPGDDFAVPLKVGF